MDSNGFGFLLFLVISLATAGCGGEGPVQPSPEEQSIQNYRFAMQQVVQQGNAVVKRYNDTVALWNLMILGPDYDAFSKMFGDAAQEVNAHLETAKRVSTPTQSIQQVHAIYLRGWQSLLAAAAIMVDVTSSRGTSGSVLLANLQQDEADKAFQEFQSAFSNLK